MESLSAQQVMTYAPNPRIERARRTHIDVSPDGKRLAYCVKTTVVIRDTKELWMVKGYHVHEGNSPTAVKFSLDTDLIASGDDKGFVFLWAVNSKGDPIIKNKFQIFTGTVRDIAWSEDGKKILVVGDGEPYVKLISVDLSSAKGDASGHSKEVLAGAVRHKRPFMAVSGGQDFILGIHKFPPLQNVGIGKAHSNFINAIAYSKESDVFVSVSSDKTIQLWEGASGKNLEVKFDTEHTLSIMDVIWINGDQFVTCSNDGTLKVWNKEGGASKKTLLYKPLDEGAEEEKETEGIKLNKMILGIAKLNEKEIIGATLDGALNFWNLEAGECQTKQLHGHHASINALELIEDTVLVVSGDQAGSLYLWKKMEGTGTKIDVKEKNFGIKNICVSHETNSILVSGYSKNLKKFIITADKSLKFESNIELSKEPSFVVKAPDKDGSFAALVKPATIIRVEGNAVAGETSIASVIEKDDVTAMTVGGSSLILGTKASQPINAQKGLIHVCTYGEEIVVQKTVKKHDMEVSALSVSPNGKMLLSGDSNRTIYSWNLDDLNIEPKKHLAHTARILSFAWNENSSNFASSSQDQCVVLWDVEQGKKGSIEFAHVGPIRTCCFAEARLITAGEDAAIKLWNLN